MALEALAGQQRPDVTFEELGGAHSHSTVSGVTHFVAADDRSAMEEIRYILSFLPANNLEAAPYFTPNDKPDRMEEEIPGFDHRVAFILILDNVPTIENNNRPERRRQ